MIVIIVKVTKEAKVFHQRPVRICYYLDQLSNKVKQQRPLLNGKFRDTLKFSLQNIHSRLVSLPWKNSDLPGYQNCKLRRKVNNYVEFVQSLETFSSVP